MANYKRIMLNYLLIRKHIKTESKYEVPPRIGIFILLTLSLFTCRQKEISPDLPIVVTGEVTNITGTGALFHAKILNTGKETITEAGFIWDTVQSPNFGSSQIRISIEEGVEAFSAEVMSDHLAGQDYYVKAFIKAGKTVAVGNWTKFTSQGSSAPVIDSFEPKAGLRKAEVTIYGTNFSYVPKHMIVKFGDHDVEVLQSTAKSIRVKLPPFLDVSGQVKITVELGGQVASSEDYFMFTGPVIDSIYPESATCRTEITLSGINFIMGSSTAVYFTSVNSINSSKTQAEIIKLSHNKIIIRVPFLYKTGLYYLIVISNNISSISSKQIEVIGVVIDSVTPLETTGGEKIIIKGSNLGLGMPGEQVFLGNKPLTFETINSNEIIAEIPSSLPVGNYTLSVSANCSNGSYNKEISITSPYSSIKNIPFPCNSSVMNFTINNIIYFGVGSESMELWAYNPINNQWAKKADFPGIGRSHAVSAVVNEKAIFGTGLSSNYGALSDFWSYDPVSDQWKTISPFKPGSRWDAQIFKIGDRIFCGAGLQYSNSSSRNVKNDFYEYDINTDTWTFIGDFIESLWRKKPITFSAKGKGYLALLNSLYEFDTYLLKWKQVDDLSIRISEAFSTDNETIIVSGQDVYYFQPWSGNLVKLPSFFPVGLRAEYTGTVLNEQFYVGFGNINSTCSNELLQLDLNDYQ